ncbi:hypothetical protein OG365_07675 [Streptomyces sp. NBC_00853]|nr:hypothetical protein OG457_12780 [Streptomyces sp. NBC_01207]WTA17947.1 hypothetical protein OG365_07675 [Streptomyces sp. NBC_00853]
MFNSFSAPRCAGTTDQLTADTDGSSERLLTASSSVRPASPSAVSSAATVTRPGTGPSWLRIERSW